MLIHLIAPKDQTKWLEVWHHCYNIWKSTPYKIKMWHDEDVDQLLKEDDEEFFDILNTLSPIYKFDYVRYLILEKFGGAYFDMDVELIINFIPLLNPNKIYLSEGENNCLISNHIMISPPDFLFWFNIKNYTRQKLIKNLSKCKDSEFWTIETVGPLALSNFLTKNALGYEYTLLSIHHFSDINSSLSFSKHYSTNSWTKNKKPPYLMYGNI
jgi:mannosyltransferase OCH1-like enzyme